ncbi:bacF [Enterococcus faecalis AZ19]|nr:bacF [Enterococcus faecalis AZ19]
MALVLTVITMMFSIISFLKDIQDGTVNTENMVQLTSGSLLFDKVVSIIDIVFSLGFIILFYLAHKTIKLGGIPSVVPYYANLGWASVYLVFFAVNLFNVNTTDMHHIVSGLILILVSMFFLLIKIPVCMVIRSIYLENQTEGK